MDEKDLLKNWQLFNEIIAKITSDNGMREKSKIYFFMCQNHAEFVKMLIIFDDEECIWDKFPWQALSKFIISWVL